MTPRIPAPRLLPATIVMIGAVLAVKSAALVRGAAASDRGYIVLASQAHEAPKQGATKPAAPHGGAAASPSAEKPPEKPPEPAGPPPPPPMSDAEKTVLLELRQRRQDLESRESVVAARESMLTAAERKVGARVEELQTLQKRLEGLEAGRQQREDASWQGLVRLYEAMKPREAAVIFNDLALPTLLQVMDRMKDAKAALVVAAMNPDKARELTTQLARLRLNRENPASATRATPAGG